MHPRAKRPLARPVKTGFFSPRQRCINTSSLPDFPSVISAVFRCTHHIPIQSHFTQLQSSVRGYVWRDKFYGTVRNIWPPMQSHSSQTLKRINLKIWGSDSAGHLNLNLRWLLRGTLCTLSRSSTLVRSGFSGLRETDGLSMRMFSIPIIHLWRNTSYKVVIDYSALNNSLVSISGYLPITCRLLAGYLQITCRYVYRVFSRASRHTSPDERRSRAFKLYRLCKRCFTSVDLNETQIT